MTTDRSKTVLVAGGAGFIGSTLVAALLKRGLAVRILDNFITGKREHCPAEAELVEADIRDLDAVRAAMRGVAYLFHAAAIPRVILSVEKPVETEFTNVIGTLNLLTAARDAGIKKFIFSGSSAVYGNQERLPVSEEMAPNPLSPYAVQKLTAEHYVRLFCRLYGLRTLTLRYFNVYGPRMPTEGAYASVIAVFLRQRREGRPLTIDGDGEQTRDFIYVDDVVRANLAAMESALGDGRAFNVGLGRSVSVKRLAELFGGKVVHRPPRPGDARNTQADLASIRSVLGWTPEVTLEEGLARLMAMHGVGRPG